MDGFVLTNNEHLEFFEKSKQTWPSFDKLKKLGDILLSLFYVKINDDISLLHYPN